MKNMAARRERYFFYLAFLLFFLKGLIWLFLTPLWQSPDEPAHFARVQALAEKGILWTEKNQKHFSRELLTSVEKMEIDKFRWETSPNFGYYRIDYPAGSAGKYEPEIKALSLADRHDWVATGSAWTYPPGYYLPAAAVYRLFFQNDLFVRAFAVRFLSLLLSLASLVFAFLIGQIFFHKNRLLSLFFTVFVGFQPMFSSLSVSVNPDSLVIFFSTGFFWLSLLFLTNPRRPGPLFWAGLFLIGGLFTKINFIFALPLFAGLVIFFFIFPKTRLQTTPAFLLLPAREGNVTVFSFFSYLKEKLADGSFWLTAKTYFADNWFYWRTRTFPTFWGVFGWEDTPLPLAVFSVLWRGMIFVLGGWLISVYRFFKNPQKDNSKPILVLFTFLFVAVNFLAAVLFDWWHYTLEKTVFGVQGRYFFTSFVPLMLLLWWGITVWFPKKYRFFSGFLLSLMMVGLNLVGLWSLVKRFYPARSFWLLVTQVSQYKPWLFKDGLVLAWLGLFVLVLFSVLFLFFKAALSSLKTPSSSGSH